MVGRFRLAVSGYQGLEAWSWTLVDHRGAEVASHQVRLDTDAWQYAALQDLHGYVTANGGGEAAEEARLVAETGDWIGEQVLGPAFCKVFEKKPAVVTLAIPGPAADIALLPLESARIDGRALRAYRVALVSVPVERATASRPRPIRDKLRVLALFPALRDAPALNQRRERRDLENLLAQIGATKSKTVEYRALQYGVTSGKLRSALESDPGWDAVHICGHATPGLLRFPRDDARAQFGDQGDDDLAELLDLVRDRLKLVTVSPCLSSAVKAAAGLGVPWQLPPGPAQPAGGWQRHGFPLVRELASQLGCAVVTFRFPVPDDFAFAYFKELYRLMIVSEQPLANSAIMALSDVFGMLADDASALSMVAPTMFGATAADLRLRAPAGKPQVHGGSTAPKYFAGRDDVMREAGAALAMWSGQSGVLLFGLPGTGKTTCASELASTRDSLDFDNTFPETIQYVIPTEKQVDIGLSLRQFAKSLDRIENFPLSAVLDDDDKFAAHLSRMSEFFDKGRFLIVLENVDVLLTPENNWRDPRWGQVIGALTRHDGFSRLLMTSRRIPTVLDPRVLVLQVPPFRHDESLLVARNLDGLRALMDGRTPGIDSAAGKRLVGRILWAARGHPKLLELANTVVADPGQLSDLLDAADDIWHRGGPGAIFGGGPGTEADYVRVMGEWTAAIVRSLTDEARGFFQILCCLAEDDRITNIIAANWPGLSSLFFPDGTAPTCAELIEVLRRYALVTVGTGYEAATHDDYILQVHPVLADYGRKEVSAERRLAVYAELAAFWIRAAATADEDNTSALLSASLYLSRLDDASAWRVLDEAGAADGSPGLAATVTALQAEMLRRAYAAPEPARMARLHRELGTRLVNAGERQQGAAHLLAAELLHARNETGPDGDETWPAMTAGLQWPQTLELLCSAVGSAGHPLRELAVAVHGGFNQVEEVLRGIVARICAVPGAEEGS